MPPLTTSYENFYNLPRTLSAADSAGLLATGLFDEEKFTSDLKVIFPNMPEDDLSCTRFRRHRVRCFMEQEVCHGETAVYARVQA
jgi:hypothetical protein